MAELMYVEGDATEPQGNDDARIIIHVCNDRGQWGKGFVVALSEKWSEPEAAYRKVDWRERLGDVQYVPVSDSITVANMIAQHDTRPSQNTALVDGSWVQRPPIRYGALARCLNNVAGYALGMGATVHAPRFGAGLAGGDWSTVELLILECLVDQHVDVTIYDLA